MGWTAQNLKDLRAFKPFQLPPTAVAAQTFHIVGPGGDSNPGARHAADYGNTLANPTVHNTGVVPIQVSVSMIDAAFDGTHEVALPGESVTLEGEICEVVVFNPHATDPAEYQLGGRMSRFPNSEDAFHPSINPPTGAHQGDDPELSGRLIGVPNGTATKTIATPFDLTITDIDIFAQVSPGSAAGTYVATFAGAGNNLISTANFDLESLVAVAVTPMTLTGTTAHLDLVKGDSIVVSAISDNADLADGDWFFAITATLP